MRTISDPPEDPQQDPPEDPKKYPPNVQHLLNLFDFSHLPEGKLRDVSHQSFLLAYTMANYLGNSAELTAGLRKLLEAKDCFVRQAVIDTRR